MFILDEPYVSDYLIETVNKNDYKVFENDITKNWAKNLSITFKNELIYTNSENALINIKDPEILNFVDLCKDKVKFRHILKEIYPDFYFEEIFYKDLFSFESKKYPCVIKPAVGFLSLGVKTVYTKEDLPVAINEIKLNMENAKGLFPELVLNSNKFIAEEFVEGDEFAIDVYYNEKGKSVVLNIYKHPFKNKNDVSDRMYITSGAIMGEYLEKFTSFFDKIGNIAKFKNFPMHIELRIKNDKIIPIEINPMRFAGWCLCDIAQYAHNINIYEYYMAQKVPKFDFDDMSIYAFILAEVPNNKYGIISFDVEKFKKDMKAEILETREFDFKKKPLFASFFIKAENYEQIKHILDIRTENYIRMR